VKSFAALYLYIGNGILKKNQIITINQDGIIIDTGNFDSEIHSTVFINGILFEAFSLPNRNEVTSEPEQILKWMQEITNEFPQMSIPESMKLFVNLTEPKPGNKITLYCIENYDFKTLRLQKYSKIKVVYP